MTNLGCWCVSCCSDPANGMCSAENTPALHADATLHLTLHSIFICYGCTRFLSGNQILFFFRSLNVTEMVIIICSPNISQDCRNESLIIYRNLKPCATPLALLTFHQYRGGTPDVSRSFTWTFVNKLAIPQPRQPSVLCTCLLCMDWSCDMHSGCTVWWDSECCCSKCRLKKSLC